MKFYPFYTTEDLAKLDSGLRTEDYYNPLNGVLIGDIVLKRGQFLVVHDNGELEALDLEDYTRKYVDSIVNIEPPLESTPDSFGNQQVINRSTVRTETEVMSFHNCRYCSKHLVSTKSDLLELVDRLMELGIVTEVSAYINRQMLKESSKGITLKVTSYDYNRSLRYCEVSFNIGNTVVVEGSRIDGIVLRYSN